MLSSKVKNTQTAEAPQAVKPPGLKGLSCLTKMYNHRCLVARGPISSKHLPSLSHGTWPHLLQTPTIVDSWHMALSPPNTYHRCLMAHDPFSSKHLPSLSHGTWPHLLQTPTIDVSWHMAPSPPNTYHRPLTGQLLPVPHAA